MRFKELDPGDIFYISQQKAPGDTFIKIRYDNFNDLSERIDRRDPNAINLDNGHRMVIGRNVTVIKI